MVNIVLSVLGRDQSGESTKTALSNIDALTSKRDQASRALSAASARDADAAGRVRVATLALADAQTKYADGSLQVARAQEQLQSAQRASTISANNLESATARAAASERRLGEQSALAERAVTEHASGMRSAMTGASTAVVGVGSSFGSMVGGVVTGSALAAGAFAIWQTGAQALDDVRDAVVNAGKASIDFDSQLENANIGFTTMLGSGSKATSMLNDLQKFALVTPFRFGDLTQYAQQMLGYGIKAKEILPDLKALGDASSASGRTDQLGNVVLAFEQMSARGRVDLQDINQLTQGGVPALKILAAQYHTTTGGILTMISTGKLLASDALPKLTEGIEHGTKSTSALGGMMTKQSQTFTGAVSNIEDALQQAGGKAFQPFFKMAERGAQVVAGLLSSKGVGKAVADGAAAITTAFKEIADDPAVGKAFAKIGPDFSKAMATAGPILDKILPKLVHFGTDELPKIADAIDDVVKHIPAMVRGWDRAATALKDWEPVVNGVIEGGAGLVKWLMDLPGTLTDVLKAWSSFWEDVGYRAADGVTYLINQFLIVPRGIIDIFNKANSAFETAGTNIVEGVISGITGAAGGVIKTVADLGSDLIGAFNHAVGNRSPSKIFRQSGLWITQGLAQGIQAGAESDVANAMDTLVGKVQTGYADLATEASKAAARKKADQAKIGKDDTRSTDLARQKAAAEDALHSAKTEKQRRAAQDRLAKIGEEVAANRKNRHASVLDLDAATGEIRADGTAAQRKQREAAILKQIAGVNTQLDALATARDNVASNLKTAQGNLDSAMQTRSDFAAGVQSSVRALGALTGATASNGGVGSWDGSTSAGQLTWQDEVSHLQAAIASASQAQATFAALKNLGLNTQSYSELESSFQSNGDLTAATSLLQGGGAAVGQVNQLENQLGGIGSSFGSDTSSTLYDAGVNAAKGVVDGLQQADDQLTTQMTKLGTALADAVSKELAAPIATRGRNAGVSVGTINVAGPSTADVIAALDWASNVSV